MAEHRRWLRFISIAFLMMSANPFWTTLSHAVPNAEQIQRMAERGKANGLLMEQKFDEALDILLRLRREARQPYEQGESDYQIGLAYFYLGDDRRAVRYFQAGLEQMTAEGYLGQAMGLGTMYPFVLSNADKRHTLAYACFRMGKLNAATGVLEPQRAKLEEFLSTNKNEVSQSTGYLSLIRYLNTQGNVQKRAGDNKGAALTFKRLVEVCEAALESQAGKAPGATITLHFRHSQALYETGKYEEALAAVDRCIAEVREAWGEKVGKTTAESYYHSHCARILQALERSEGALKSAETALQIAEAEPMSNWSQPEAACHVAELHQLMGNLSEAETAYRRASTMVEAAYTGISRTGVRAGLLESNVSVYPRLASLLAEQNRWEESFAAAEAGRSRALLDMLGNAPPRETGAVSIDSDIIKKEEAYAREMLRLKRQSQAASWNPQIDTRALRTDYRRLQAEYDSFRNTVALEHPGYAVFQTIQTATENDLRELFAGNPVFAQAAVLSYLVTDEAVLGYCFDGSKLHGELLSADALELANDINQLRTQIALRDANWRESAHRLHELLIQPFANHLADKQRLLVIPHQSLHFLPFAVLCDESMKTLIERHEICTIPSGSILKLWSQPGWENDATPTQTEGKAIVIANPDGSLPFAEGEVASVKQAYPTAIVLRGNAATEDKVFSLAPTAEILHFATHGLSNPVRPDYSHLKLAQPAGESDVTDGLLDVHEIVRRLDVSRARLVVLSACETAMGPASRGDEVQSLANAFLCAGAREVVATLWAVDDEATADLMDEFYLALSEGPSPAAAMRRSMMQSVREGRHPYEWAAFLVIGPR